MVLIIFGNSKNLVNAIKRYLNGDWEVHCIFSRRDANKCADRLAKEGAISNYAELSSIQSPPVFIQELLFLDSSCLASAS